MKASYLLVILLLLLPAQVSAGRINNRNISPKQTPLVSYWQTNSVVNVYFVRNMFTSDERQVLWNAIEAWKQRANKSGLEINFVLAGETGGLIDCVGCLTIARQVLNVDVTKQHVSFNPLRQNHAGRLISAWIGVERVSTSPQSLKTLFYQAFESGLGTGPELAAARGRS